MEATNSQFKLEFENENKDEISELTEISAVEFEIITPDKFSDARREKIAQGIADIDERLSVIDDEVSELNAEIDRLTNHADGIDYTIAVASGVVTGLLDAFFVETWDFETAKGISNKDMNDLIMSKAKKEGYSGNRLDGAIAKLEEKFKLPGDNDWKSADIGVSATSHHLDDFAHHPTPVGLICSMLSQFTEQAFYSNKNGDLAIIPISVNKQNKFIGKNVPAKLFCGVVNWCMALIRNWKGHLMSDMAGSKATAGAGMGIPGPMLATLKEISALPVLNDTELPAKIHKAYTKGIGTKKGQIDLGAFNVLFDGASSKMDMRTENAIKHELGRQAILILVNEAIVRGFYFIRRLYMELKEKSDLELVNWNKVLPFKNRTIARMLTISTGTLMAVDLADAGIRAVIKSEGLNLMTLEQFILRVNFVGVGRFAIAVATDVGMGVKKRKKENERRRLLGEQIALLNTKLYFKNADLMCSYGDLYEKTAEMHAAEADLWIEVQSTTEMMEELQAIENAVASYFISTFNENIDIYHRMGSISVEGLEQNNPEVFEAIFRR